MTLTVVDPQPALIVIDLQEGIVGYNLPGTDEVIARSAQLADAFRVKGHPVVLVNVSHGVGGRSDRNPEGGVRELEPAGLPVVAALGTADIAITKRTAGAFHATSLEADLAVRGVTQVFLAGIATGTGVEAAACGYNVVTVTDAMLDMDPEVHDFCVHKVFGKWSQTTTTDEVLAAL